MRCQQAHECSTATSTSFYTISFTLNNTLVLRAALTAFRIGLLQELSVERRRWSVMLSLYDQTVLFKRHHKSSMDVFCPTYWIKFSSSLLEALIGGAWTLSAFLPPLRSAMPPNMVDRTPMASCRQEVKSAVCLLWCPATDFTAHSWRLLNRNAEQTVGFRWRSEREDVRRASRASGRRWCSIGPCLRL